MGDREAIDWQDWEEICGEHCINHITRWYRHKTKPLEMELFTRVSRYGPGKTRRTIKAIRGRRENRN